MMILKKSKNKSDIYSTCILGKIKKKPFPTSKNKHSTSLLELIHSDILIHITPTSKGGSKYVISFVDYYSTYAVVKSMNSRPSI